MLIYAMIIYTMLIFVSSSQPCRYFRCQYPPDVVYPAISISFEVGGESAGINSEKSQFLAHSCVCMHKQ